MQHIIFYAHVLVVPAIDSETVVIGLLIIVIIVQYSVLPTAKLRF